MAYPPQPLPPAWGPPAPAPPRPVVRPSGWWYAAAVALAVIGVVLAGYALRQGFRDAEAAALDSTATSLGTDQTITITRPQSTTVAYTGIQVTFDEQDRQDLIRDLEVSIVGAGDGQELPLGEYDGYRPINDTVDGRAAEYLPLFTVRFDQPGDYVLSTRAVPGVDLDQSAVVVSESPFRKLRDGARRAAAFAGGGTLGWLLLTMILARTRGRAKRAWRAAHPPPAPTWGPQPGWGAPPGWGGPPPGGGGWGPGPPGGPPR